MRFYTGFYPGLSVLSGLSVFLFVLYWFECDLVFTCFFCPDFLAVFEVELFGVRLWDGDYEAVAALGVGSADFCLVFVYGFFVGGHGGCFFVGGAVFKCL